ncbi:MAG TPA: penicillin-binding protein 2 [Nitrospirales bacterium]|nr:penicillin-binding protein 2 [Nitrospirales bacterium]
MESVANQSENLRRIQRRLIVLRLSVVVVLAILLIRVWYIQIVKGEEYAVLSEQNRVRMVYLKPPRGLIYDRHHNLLANNIPSFNLYVVLSDVDDRQRLREDLSELIGVSVDDVRVAMEKHHTPRLPLKLKEGLTLKEAAAIESSLAQLPGVVIQAETERSYPQGTVAAHIIGYVGEVSAKGLKEEQFQNLVPGSAVGKYGVELEYDRIVRGRVGQKTIEVDARGHEQRAIQIQEPIPGDDLYLTIDLPLQRLAEDLLGDSAGVVVALDPRNGDVLVLASHPTFDPNTLARGLTVSQWNQIRHDPKKPMTNRATQGQYPPGSVFKLVVAAAGLESGSISRSTPVDCRGQFAIGDRVFKDWKKGGHGLVTLHEGLVHSCDIYFYTLGQQLGIDQIAHYAVQLGLGHRTGIDLPAENSGIVPSREWKERALGKPWYPGETISVAIGQGFVTVTPLQMASLIGTIANNGVQYQPRVVRQLKKRQDGTLVDIAPSRSETVQLQQETLTALHEALRDVVVSGTGRRAQSRGITISGKTGTAQVVSLDNVESEDDVPHALRDHAWFVAYAPSDDPKIAVSVIVEHMGHGGAIAAPIARAIIDEYFQPDRVVMVP